MPDEDPFEIAKRLDQYGAGNGPKPPRPPKPVAAPAKKPRRGLSQSTKLFLALILLAGVAWWLHGHGYIRLPIAKTPPSNQTSSSPQNAQNPQFTADPPKTIPSINGDGEVPAFTVQTPSPTPAKSQTPSP